MSTVKVPGLNKKVFRIGLGTWAIGGWMWGGTRKKEAKQTLRTAFEETPINLIDTAPVYGFGRSEQICGEALQDYGKREEIVVATKAGLNWTEEEQVFRDCRPERIKQEIHASLRRLQVDYIDIYQIHWPDKTIPLEETAEVMHELYQEGKIRGIGVCNYDREQMELFRQAAPLHTSQPPYNLFERAYEQESLPYCKNEGIIPLTYGALCRGLLSGKVTPARTFPNDDIRAHDPKFQSPRFSQYYKAVRELDKYAKDNFNKSVLHLAVRWILDRPWSIVPLWGARQPQQLEPVTEVMDFSLSKEDEQNIEQILSEFINDPVSPNFMAPPTRKELQEKQKD